MRGSAESSVGQMVKGEAVCVRERKSERARERERERKRENRNTQIRGM